MNVRRILLGLTAAALVLGTVPATATDPGMDQEAMMKKWMEMSAPGEGHAIFDKYVGKWDCVVKSWMDPKAPPTETKGTSEYSKILGGRFLLQTFNGDMMGMPFEGRGTTGYDNLRKEYVAIWTDNFSTSIMKMTGQKKDDMTIELSGLMDDAMTGEKDKKIRSVEKWIDDDHVNFEMYDTIPGMGQVKVMEINYTRAK
jgi:hypothetical protein